MTDKKGSTAVDWEHFDWTAVNDELDKRDVLNVENTEVESLPRDMFVDYIRWLHDTKPEMFHILMMMEKADREGAPQEEIDKWKALWDSYGQEHNS